MTRGLVGLVLALAVLFGTASPATAVNLPDVPGVDIDCKTAPVAELPGRGSASWLLPTPETPPTEDPFAEGSTTTVFEAYGTAGLRFSTYDLGCGPDAARDPAAVSTNAIANLLMGVAKQVVGGTAALADTVYDPTWLSSFDAPLTTITRAINDSIFRPLAPVAFIIAAGVVAFAARRMALGKAAATVAFAFLAIFAAALSTTMPVALGSTADRVIVETTGAISNTITGDQTASSVAAVAPLADTILMDRWLAGTLGSATSDTAVEYGDDLYRNSALTWAEAAQYEADPTGAGQDILDAKADAWTATAEAIQDSDPDAYEYLIGRRGEDRMGEAAIATVASLLVLPFLAISFLLVVASFVIIRMLVMFMPVLALLWIVPSMHSIAKGAATMAVAAVINAIVFAVGSTVGVLVVGLLLSPETALPPLTGLILAAVFCVVMWYVLAPFRKLTALVGGDVLAHSTKGMQKTMDETRDRAWSAGTAVAGTAWGSRKGFKAGAKDFYTQMRDPGHLHEEPAATPDGFYRGGNFPAEKIGEHPDVPEGLALPAGRTVGALPAEPSWTATPYEPERSGQAPRTEPLPVAPEPKVYPIPVRPGTVSESETSGPVYVPVPMDYSDGDTVVTPDGQDVHVAFSRQEGYHTTSVPAADA